MAEKQDIAMNQFQTVTDADYVYVEKGNSQGKIKKSELIHVNASTGFNGDFKDPANFPKSGIVIYNVNTELSGTTNAPSGISVFYGMVEIISRADITSNTINVVTIKIYEHIKRCFMIMGVKHTGENTYNWGEWKQIY